MMLRWLSVMVAAVSVSVSGADTGGSAAALRVGAAKVDITPTPADMPPPYKTILDPIFVRAVTLESGGSRAAIVTVDAVNIGDSVAAAAAQKIARESGIPADRVMISATHSHSAPRAQTPQETARPNQPPAPAEPKATAYNARLVEQIAEAVKRAKASEQSAKVGYGTGLAYLNVNRDFFNPADNHWYLYQPYQGFNTDGPSDKTVSVIKYETLTGEPIAFYINYAVHGVVNNGGGGSEISGDLPGSTSRFVEDYYKGKVVAQWASGAAGDQHPLHKVWVDRVGGPIPAELEQTHPQLFSMGRTLGEEAIFVGSHIKTTSEARVWGGQKVVGCAGQLVTPRNHPLFCAYPGYPVSNPKLPACANFKTEDAESGTIRLSLLMVNKIAIAGISGEPLTLLGQHVKKASPFTQTIVMGLTNGASGYLPDDANYDKFTYESTTSKFKRGCVESSIVDGFVSMMNAY